MLNVIDRPEKLWQSCAELTHDPKVIESNFFGCPDDHFVLAYGPVAQRNQYQALLYSAKDKFNVSILPIHQLDLLGAIPWPGRVICHFHWIHEQTRLAKTESEANKVVVYWENIIKRIKKNGHKIVWTVHNVMPHETVWIEQDRKIHQMMADAADALHVMANDSAKLTEPYYHLDQKKVFCVPHPTYEGAQPDTITRPDARRQLQIGDSEFVFLSFGAIMEYKGYDALMNAYDIVRNKVQRKIRLIIAGLPSDKVLVEEIRRWGQGKEDVILDMSPIPNDKLQVFFKSADIAICPYRRTMNSGAAMMALTFGIPVVGPHSGGFVDIKETGCGLTYDNNSYINLVNIMFHLVNDESFSAENFVNARFAYSPSHISNLFFSKINKLIN